MRPIEFTKGDATAPPAEGNRIIAHICNDAGKWGKGFVLAVSRREDKTEYGCFGWQRHAEYVLMSGEVELAAWDWHGRKLWSTFVEPLWHYAIRGDMVNLDVMGRKSSFALSTGPLP